MALLGHFAVADVIPTLCFMLDDCIKKRITKRNLLRWWTWHENQNREERKQKRKRK
jgi:hypothetical protein